VRAAGETARDAAVHVGAGADVATLAKTSLARGSAATGETDRVTQAMHALPTPTIPFGPGFVAANPHPVASAMMIPTSAIVDGVIVVRRSGDRMRRAVASLPGVGVPLVASARDKSRAAESASASTVRDPPGRFSLFDVARRARRTRTMCCRVRPTRSPNVFLA